MTIEEIESMYREHCKHIGIKFSKKEFERFLIFLEVDFYDWVRGNLRYFDPNEKYPYLSQ
ncbi:hypothetical protein HYY70_02915 [Candidatus Woesearchaeota archaeon]|nr:hypothetical protein [Candidatus Woesearchaeota archaeon]